MEILWKGRGPPNFWKCGNVVFKNTKNINNLTSRFYLNNTLSCQFDEMTKEFSVF